MNKRTNERRADSQVKKLEDAAFWNWNNAQIFKFSDVPKYCYSFVQH